MSRIGDKLAKDRQSINISLYMLIVFCGFFTVKLGFSLVYITFIIGTFFFFISVLEGNKKWEFISLNILILSFTIFLIICLLATWNYEEGSLTTWINLSFSLIYFYFCSIILSNSKVDVIIKAVNSFFAASIIILSMELTFRLANPEIPADWTELRDDIWWQLYKTSSFMYPDSNSVGLFVVCLIAFLFTIPDKYGQQLKKYFPILLIFLFGSLSRSSIITFIVIMLFQLSKSFQAKSVVRTLLLIACALTTYPLIMLDESFLSKVWIFGLVIDYLTNADATKLLIGVGPGNGTSQIGVGTHILPLTLLVEVGLCGLALTGAIWYKAWRASLRISTLMFLALFINGLSFSTFAIPWFYAMITVVIRLANEDSSASFNTHSRL